jgi:hypothetical protein
VEEDMNDARNAENLANEMFGMYLETCFCYLRNKRRDPAWVYANYDWLLKTTLLAEEFLSSNREMTIPLEYFRAVEENHELRALLRYTFYPMVRRMREEALLEV